MELKFILGATSDSGTNGSNRTFMELKSASTAIPLLTESVLIAPLWN